MGSKLKQLIIIHRHGARYPLKRIPGDLSWPTNKEFWNNYSGHLTPEGTMQMISIGIDLRSYYNEFISNINTDSIRVQVSNSQRTAMSAWSFLMGMFPNKSKYFKYIGDSRNKKLNNNISDHITIRIETDKLFHLEDSEKRSEFGKKNLESSVLFNKFVSDKNSKDLCDKLYKMTKLEKLSPSFAIVDRLIELKRIHTQIKIATVHNLEILPNTIGEKVTEQDIKYIDIIGNEVKSRYYIPGDDKISDDCGASNASYLLNEIFRYIINSKYKFIEISGHDITLLSLSSLLGIKITVPEFGSYFIFEVYDNDTIKIYYNPDPIIYSRKDLINKRWEISDMYQDWNNISEGEFTINEFGERYNLFKLQRIYSLISNIKRLDVNNINLNVNSDEIYQNYPDVVELFKYIDENNNNSIQFNEFLIFFERLGLFESCDSLIEIFNEADLNNDKSLDLCEFFKILIQLGY